MKKITAIISAVVALIVVAAIAGFIILSGPKETPDTTTTDPVTTEAPKDYSRYNRLTGLETLSDGAIGKRPVAIMINNIKASLPQYGIYGADIMYEVPVEGGITRMMALFGDYTKVPDVCSIRSCRYYFPVLAHGYDAVYFCFGINETIARPVVEKIGIDWFNGNDKFDQLLFGRDSERLKKYSREHTAFVKGENIPEALNKYNVRSDISEAKNGYAFSFKEENSKSGTIPADSLRLDFSKLYYSTFEYNKDTKTYYKTHCGKAHMDTANNKQLNYKNVFILETEVKLHTDGYLMKVDWKGGTGYYVSMGAAQKITWQKPDADSQIKFFDETGAELKVNTGNSYIGILSPGAATIKSAAEAQ